MLHGRFLRPNKDGTWTALTKDGSRLKVCHAFQYLSRKGQQKTPKKVNKTAGRARQIQPRSEAVMSQDPNVPGAQQGDDRRPFLTEFSQPSDTGQSAGDVYYASAHSVEPTRSTVPLSLLPAEQNASPLDLAHRDACIAALQRSQQDYARLAHEASLYPHRNRNVAAEAARAFPALQLREDWTLPPSEQEMALRAHYRQLPQIQSQQSYLNQSNQRLDSSFFDALQARQLPYLPSNASQLDLHLADYHRFLPQQSPSSAFLQPRPPTLMYTPALRQTEQLFASSPSRQASPPPVPPRRKPRRARGKASKKAPQSRRTLASSQAWAERDLATVGALSGTARLGELDVHAAQRSSPKDYRMQLLQAVRESIHQREQRDCATISSLCASPTSSHDSTTPIKEKDECRESSEPLDTTQSHRDGGDESTSFSSIKHMACLGHDGLHLSDNEGQMNHWIEEPQPLDSGSASPFETPTRRSLHQSQDSTSQQSSAELDHNNHGSAIVSLDSIHLTPLRDLFGDDSPQKCGSREASPLGLTSPAMDDVVSTDRPPGSNDLFALSRSSSWSAVDKATPISTASVENQQPWDSTLQCDLGGVDDDDEDDDASDDEEEDTSDDGAWLTMLDDHRN
jgi:hypothetical protein